MWHKIIIPAPIIYLAGGAIAALLPFYFPSISNPNELTELRKREKQCNLLILKTMGNKNNELIAARDLVCELSQ